MPIAQGVAIDGGAHIGVWTEALAKKFKKVLAYEPEPRNAKLLRENVGRLENVRVHQKALGWIPEQNVKVMWRLPEKTDTARIGSRGEIAQTTSLDAEGLKDVTFIKLDLDGFEYYALRGAETVLRMWKPMVLIEEKHELSEHYGIPTGEARRWLESIGMRVVETFHIDVLLGWGEQA